MKLLLFIFILVFSSGIKSDELLISSKINAVLPDGMSVQSIKESQIENLFIVDIGDLQPIYASKDGEFFFYGELYAVNGNMLQNTTKDEINSKRKSILDKTSLSISLSFITRCFTVFLYLRVELKYFICSAGERLGSITSYKITSKSLMIFSFIVLELATPEIKFLAFANFLLYFL